MKTATKKVTYTATFQESIAGAVLVNVARNRRRIDLGNLPAGVIDYLSLKKSGSGCWVFDIDGHQRFDDLVACAEVTEKKQGKKKAPRRATATFTVESYNVKQIEPAEQLPNTWGDGAKWGVSDWYEELEAAITAALARGKSYAWTTGWYSSKKEIMSACVSQRGGEIAVEVSVSDDFDTEGRGKRTIRFTKNLDRIREALDAAADAAESDRKDNQTYIGFSVGRGDRWEYTLVLPIGEGHEMYMPPGDNYHRWGWQEVEDGEEHPAEVPSAVAAKLLAWAEDPMVEVGSKTVGEWTIRTWEKEKSDA
jgi:hypothetical protein